MDEIIMMIEFSPKVIRDKHRCMHVKVMCVYVGGIKAIAATGHLPVIVPRESLRQTCIHQCLVDNIT